MTRTPYPLRDPWVISAAGKAQVLDVWTRAHDLGLAARIATALDREGEPFKNERQAEVIGGVAVITVDGPLMRKAELFTDISGATSYQWIRARLDEAVSSAAVHAILLRCTSPGGEAFGCGELADFIAALPKHCEAYVETLACSGMQWLISGCKRTTAHETAWLGSIGARMMVTDDSERDAKAGIKEHEVVSDGSPGKRNTPVDAEVLARAQERCNGVAAPFFSAMARNRGVSMKTVLSDFGAGDVVAAPRAIEAKLADALGDFDSTLAALIGAKGNRVSVYPSASTKGRTMPTPTATVASEQSGHPPWSCASCKQEMGGNADAYCAHCMDGKGGDDSDEDEDDADAKALVAVGLLGKTRGETRAKLSAFALDAIARSGGKSAAEASGKIEGGVKATRDLDTFRAEALARAGTEKIATWRSAITGALAGSLSLGAACKVVPSFIQSGPEHEKVVAALAALPSQTAAGITGALCLADASALNLEGLQGFVGTLGDGLPRSHTEPPPTEENRVSHVTATAPEARKFGLTVEAINKFANITSVADLPRPGKGA